MKTIYSDVHFDSKDAIKYGTNQSILLNHIGYICNCENSDYFKDGRYWYRITAQKLHERFKFMCLRTIKSCLKDLVNKKALVTNTFNDKATDRTIWYSYNICTMHSAELALSEDHSAEIAPTVSAELALSSIYKEIKKEVVEEQKTTTTNSVKDFESTFNEDYQKIGEFVKFHKLYGLKAHLLLIYKHFLTHEDFLEEVNSISEWKKFPKDQIVDEYENRTFTLQQKRIVTVSILKTVGFILQQQKE